MKNNLIIKIAFGVSIVALVFSVITLIRAVVLGARVVFPVIQVIGTLAIAAICAVMLFTLNRQESEESNEDGEEPPSKTAEEAPNESAELTEDDPDTDLEAKYNWSNFQ